MLWKSTNLISAAAAADWSISISVRFFPIEALKAVSRVTDCESPTKIFFVCSLARRWRNVVRTQFEFKSNVQSLQPGDTLFYPLFQLSLPFSVEIALSFPPLVFPA